MAEIFDLVVIGTGSAAISVALPCRAAGWKVAVVDSRPYGGTCVLRGCDPKKVLVGAADSVDWTRRMQDKGIDGELTRIDWPALMRFKHTFTDPVPKQREKTFADAGITTLHGIARFTGPTTLAVDGAQLEARHIVLATGAKPRPLGIPGEELLTISDQFLDLESLPRRITFLGGGYISLEFAHLALRTGVQVTILHRGTHVLDGFDPDLIAMLTAEMREMGARVELGVEVKSIEQTSGGLITRAKRKSGADVSVESDIVVHGAGRTPNLQELNLQTAGVESGLRGVAVNEYLQSVSNPAVYAIGDCSDSGGPPLTPIAGYEGRTAAANLLEGNRHSVSYTAIPTVAFTIPPIASVGMLESKAGENQLKFRVNHGGTAGWYSSRRTNEHFSGYKVLLEEGTGKILGVHLLGPLAEEVINLFALAMNAGMPASRLKQVIFAYPTHASDVQYMLE